MSMKSRLAALPLVLALAATPALAQLKKGEAATAEQVATGEVPAAPIDESEKALRALQSQANLPMWNDRSARELLSYVERVGEEGLDPADYSPDLLREAISRGEPMALRTVATDIFLRLSSDLALGHARGDDRLGWHVIDPDLDSNAQYAMMHSAVQAGGIRNALNALLPTHPQYAELKGVLAVTTDAAVRDKVRTNLDRWRWLPRELGPRYVIVNVPAYTVALVENGQVVVRHRTVVGAPKTATPQLSATATGVIFNPWWEVPKSITPEVQGKKGYVRVKAGEGFRYRQPPGAGNALGRMKVVMPNNHAIYLHDTPSKHLFKNKARAYSHGCIRTQDALGFAEALLESPEWDKTKIAETIAGGKTVQATASIATPVYITYFTAAAAADGAGIVAYKDIYDRDGKVVVALNDRATTGALASVGN